MNILIFTTAFHPSIGGLERQTIALIYEFLKKGHTIKVITMQVPVIGIAGLIGLKEVDIYYQPGILKRIQLYNWCNIFYMPNISLKGAWLWFLNPFKKWIISHNDFYLSNGKNIKVGLKLFLIKFASHNIAVSKSVAKHINTKSIIIFNCFDNDIFKIYEDEEKVFDFVFLGRLVSQKGCDQLIRACKHLNVPFTLNIIGDGPERSKLEEMVQDLDLKERIKFLGVMEGRNLARMLNKHKVMIIPSVGKEGFGIVALEGMACGCRIIAADAGGLCEAVNGFGKIFTMNEQQELEYLLKKELDEIRESCHHPHSRELVNYLASHHKDVIAREYLSLFL